MVEKVFEGVEVELNDPHRHALKMCDFLLIVNYNTIHHYGVKHLAYKMADRVESVIEVDGVVAIFQKSFTYRIPKGYFRNHGLSAAPAFRLRIEAQKQT